MHYGSILFTIAGFGFVVGLAIGASACGITEPDSNHCARRDGNAACMEEFGDVRRYCVMCGEGARVNDGCVEEEPTDHECYSPCGDMQSYEESSMCIEVGDGGADDDEEVGDEVGDGDGDGDGDGEPAACTSQADCVDSAMPFCDLDSGKCVGCKDANGDASCAELHPNMPVCADSNTCVGCSEHDQCSDSACNMAVGNCIDVGNILHVDGDETQGTGDGSVDKPYSSIGEALGFADDEVLIILHKKDNDVPYSEQVMISTMVAVFAAEGEDMRVQGTGGEPAFSVGPEGALFLRGFRVSGSDQQGIWIDGGSAWVQQMRVINNDEGGIVVDGGGTLVMENSFVGGDENRRMVYIGEGKATIIYSTIGSGFGNNSRGIACEDGTNSSVRNSIIVSYDDKIEIDCPYLQQTSNFTDSNSGLIFDDTSGWFVNFEKGDFHLSGNHPKAIETVETWIPGDPTIDIDGDPRPMTDPGFAGADVFAP